MKRFRTPIILICIFAALSLHWNDPQISRSKGAPFFKIYLSGNVLFASEQQKGIRLFDITDLTSPQSIAYLAMAGNADVAASGTSLYCDSYQDLIVYDFSNASHPVVIDTIKNVFKNYKFSEIYPSNDNANGTGGLSGCDGCTKVSSVNAPDNSSKNGTISNSTNASGSTSGYDQNKFMSRFIIVDHYLYCIDNTQIAIYDITNEKVPEFVKRLDIGFSIEMISLQKNMLFVGGQNAKSIFSIDNPLIPTLVSTMNQIQSIDPVVVQDTLAFITQHGNSTNELRVVGLKNTAMPVNIGSKEVDRPYGLAVDGQYVFVAAAGLGVKIIDSKNPQSMNEVGQIYGINVFDVVKRDRTLFTVGGYGIYIYDLSFDPTAPLRISTIRAII